MLKSPGVLLAGLLTLAVVFALGCQQEPIPVRATATPDIPATVTALAQEPTATPVPTPTPAPTPNIEATVEVRLAATVAVMPTDTPVPTPAPQPTDTPTPTPTPTPTATPTPSPTPTATPTSVPTATPTPRPTNTPRPTYTPRPTRTPTPTPTPLPALKYSRTHLLFGPEDGQIVHNPKEGGLQVYEALPAPGYVLVEAVFRNPIGDTSQYWSHGFLLKSDGPNRAYWVGFKSTGVWRHFHRLGSSEQRGERNTHTEGIDLKPGASNLLQVVYADGQGWVYINGGYQGSFSMTANTGGDRVAIYVSDKDLGTTRWADFSVWRWHLTMYWDFPEADPSYVSPPTPTSLPTATPNPKVPVFGPASGSILHDSEDGFLEVYRGPTIQGDLMLEVTFEVPFAPNESHWNFGLQLKSDQPGQYHIIEMSGLFGGSWYHWRVNDRGWHGSREQGRIRLNLQKGEVNHIRLIVVDKDGWLYVNDRRIGIANLSLGNIPSHDQINLIIDDTDNARFEYDRGGKTRFEDFTVWKWHPSLFDLPKDD